MLPYMREPLAREAHDTLEGDGIQILVMILIAR